MAIDARIPLIASQGPQQTSNVLAQMLPVVREQRATERRNSALQTLLSGGDRAEAIRTDPSAVLAYDESQASRQKGLTKAGLQKAETAYKLLKSVSGSENPVATYQSARQQYLSIYPEDATTVPERYDPAFVQDQISMGDRLFAPEMPKTLVEWEAYQNMTPEEREAFINMKRASQVRDIGGSVVTLSPTQPGTVTGQVEKTLPPQDRPDVKRAQAAATATGAEEGKREGTKPARKIAAATAKRELEIQHNILLGSEGQVGDIDRAINMVSNWTAGMGALTSTIPGTPGYDLQELLNTIRANIGFDKLQAMREASPTGGALGQVSENENRLLQSVMGSVEQSQSPQQLRSNLERLKAVLRERKSARDDAFIADFGDGTAERGTATEYDYIPGRGLVPRN